VSRTLEVGDNSTKWCGCFDGPATALTCFGGGGLVGVVVGSVFDEGGFAGSLPGTDGNGRGGCTVIAVVSPIFAMPPHSSTTTEGSCGDGLGCDDEE